MSQFTDAWEKEVLKHYFRGQTSQSQSTYHIGLHTSDPTDSGDTTAEVNEGSTFWNNYSRQGLSATTGAVTSPSTESGGGHLVDNSTTISFSAASMDSSTDEVTVSHFSVNTHASSTNSSDQMVMHSTLDASKTVGDGDAVQFSAGDLDLIVR